MRLRPAAALSVLLLCGGCSFSVSSSVRVDPRELERHVSDALEESVGKSPEAVTCPEPLKGEVGAETRCTLTDGDVRYGVTVTATKVRGTDVRMAVLVDKEPLGQGERS